MFHAGKSKRRYFIIRGGTSDISNLAEMLQGIKHEGYVKFEVWSEERPKYWKPVPPAQRGAVKPTGAE